jgi:leader peptidase (prepilin peptidase) / N-methyltransferase
VLTGVGVLAGVGPIDPVDVAGSGRILLIVVAALLGLLIGSFLNVVVARVPDGRSVVHPGSACPHCGEPIRARDNIPVVSWLLLAGRGRCCGQPISIRYPLVEAGTAVAFGAVTAWIGLSWLLPAILYLAAISIVLALIDVDHHRLPNAIVLPSYPVTAVLLIVPALTAHDPGRIVRALICGLSLYAFYFILMVISPRGMGFGDVKLAGILGGYLGWFSWGSAVVGGFLGFGVGGVAGLLLMLARRAGMKTLIPFGPYMLIGAWLALVYGHDISSWYLERSGLSDL